jgi:hypothetical protein
MSGKPALGFRFTGVWCLYYHCSVGVLLFSSVTWKPLLTAGCPESHRGYTEHSTNGMGDVEVCTAKDTQSQDPACSGRP